MRYKLLKPVNKDRKYIFILGFISLFESFVYILSLGHYDTDLRAFYLFEWVEKKIRGKKGIIK